MRKPSKSSINIKNKSTSKFVQKPAGKSGRVTRMPAEHILSGYCWCQGQFVNFDTKEIEYGPVRFDHGN